MKRVLTVFVVLMVIASAVFAADSEKHTIKVNAIRSEVLPAFQISFNDEVKTNNEATPFGNYTYDAEYPDVIHFEMANQKVVFSVGVGNEAVTKKVFRIKVSGGVFEDVPLNDGNTKENINPTITVSGSSRDTYFTSSPLSGSDKGVSVSFTGKVLDSPEQNKVADFTFAYPQRTDIQPGEYNSTITVDITIY